MRLFVATLSFLLLLSSVTTAWALYTRFTATNDKRAENAHIWHAVVCDIERNVVRSRKVSSADKASFLVFYDKLLVQDAHAAPCGIKSPGR